MKLYRCFHLTLCTLALLTTLIHKAVQEKPIVVVIPSWNNIAVCEKNLTSVFMQNYTNYSVLYIDDCSTDGTATKVKALIQKHNQSERWKVICNDTRHGIMYNHYMAAHLCPNNVIIVNLDGDDQFAHSEALNRINEAYQDDNVWMTYGQYLEWPNKSWPTGKPGICRKIPDAIHHYRAYRYYDWITSHVRTFYAGLFKAIPVGYFIHNHEFQPSAVDHAMMYSMLELSKGRVHFIEETLYWYNCENPNNVFRTMVLTDMTMGYISRGREPLEALEYDPRDPAIGNMDNAHIAIYYFATGGADRTQLCIKSLEQHLPGSYDIYILYETYDEAERQAYQHLAHNYAHIQSIDVFAQGGLQNTLLQHCNAEAYSHVLLLSAGSFIARTPLCDIQTMIRMIEKTHATGFYIHLGKDVVSHPLFTHDVQQPYLVEIEPDIYAWKFSKAAAGWRHVYTTNGALYKMKNFRTSIAACAYKNHATLEQALQLLPAPHVEDVGLCHTCAIGSSI